MTLIEHAHMLAQCMYALHVVESQANIVYLIYIDVYPTNRVCKHSTTMQCAHFHRQVCFTCRQVTAAQVLVTASHKFNICEQTAGN